MKLSSISLVAAAIAAIGGSAIPTPGPLRARALEEINPFERDLDVYSRESGVALLERDVDGDPVDARWKAQTPIQKVHTDLFVDLRNAAHTNREAAIDAGHASRAQYTDTQRDLWNGVAKKRSRVANELEDLSRKHLKAAESPGWTPLYQKRRVHNSHAKQREADGKIASERAALAWTVPK